MDATINHSEERQIKISKINKTIEIMFLKMEEIDKEKFIYSICDEYRCSRRTAIEYLMTALVQFSYEEIKKDGRKFIRYKQI